MLALCYIMLRIMLYYASIMLVDASGCWRMLVDAGGCWQMLVDAGGCWLMLADAGCNVRNVVGGLDVEYYY